MKIGIIIRGISFGLGKADFRKCASNIETNLIKPLIEEGHEVSTYVCTYEHEHIEELKEIYKPKSIEILPFEGSNQITTFIHSLNMINEEDIDFIFVTRFDLNYLNKVTESGIIDYKKVNFMYPPHDPWLDVEFVSDLVLWLPKQYIGEMIQASENLLLNPPRPTLLDMHGIYKCLKLFLSEDKIHFQHPVEKPYLVELVR
jgi:hypothetical protein